MDRYNEPADTVDSPSRDILNSPSDRTTPSMEPLSLPSSMISAEEDDAQLRSVHSSLLGLLRQQMEFTLVDTEVGRLQGHQDLKEMFSRLMFDPTTVQRIRYFADMIELIERKLDALKPRIAQEIAAEDNRIAELDTDEESEEESDDEPAVSASNVFDSDDLIIDPEMNDPYASIEFDSDDEPVMEGSGPYDPFAVFGESKTEGRLSESKSQDESDSDRELDDVASRLRF